MKKIFMIIIFISFIFILSGCTAGPNTLINIPSPDGTVAGFWWGLWHGIIAPITFIISLFNENIGFYEIHNNGSWYNFCIVPLKSGQGKNWSLKVS